MAKKDHATLVAERQAARAARRRTERKKAPSLNHEQWKGRRSVVVPPDPWHRGPAPNRSSPRASLVAFLKQG
jgi:hypothetical protein